MRGIAFLLLFLSSLPFIFITPFNGVLVWYVFSLGNFHTLTWGFLDDLYYAYIIAILTCVSWGFSRTEEKRLPMTPLVVLTLLFSLWMTITSFFALAPPEAVWPAWIFVHKILFMCLVGYALTTTRERVSWLIWAVVLSVGFWGVKGTISFVLHGGGGGGIHGADGGITADNNAFGLALVMLLPLVFYQWQMAENRYLRGGVMIMGVLIIFAAIFTYSRGGMLGLCAMGAVFWLKSRAKLASGLIIVVVGLLTYELVPEQWFDRMSTIQNYGDDPSAMGRLYYWQIALRIAEVHPVVGGGFNVTAWPAATNPMLSGTAIPLLAKGRSVHSIYMEVLSEHGWVGLGLFLAITLYSWLNCSWLIRNSRGRADLLWANMLGRMGQAVLVGYWVAGAFLSVPYFDQYWGTLFIFDAARRLAAKEITASAGAAAIPIMRPRVLRLGAGPTLATSDDRPRYAGDSP